MQWEKDERTTYDWHWCPKAGAKYHAASSSRTSHRVQSRDATQLHSRAWAMMSPKLELCFSCLMR